MITIPKHYIDSLRYTIGTLPKLQGQQPVFNPDPTWSQRYHVVNLTAEFCITSATFQGHTYSCTEPIGHIGPHIALWTGRAPGQPNLCCPPWTYAQPSDGPKQAIILSYGKKAGQPSDVAEVCRISALKVHNPYKDDELRKLNGLAPEVQERLLLCGGFKAALVVAVKVVAKQYRAGQPKYAFYCQGGKHRSVALAEAFPSVWYSLREQMTNMPDLEWSIVHRDLPVK